MSLRVDPTFLHELKAYGALGIEKCFNCGICTAICPLSTTGETFPRRLIRYGQLGLKKPLLGSKELWMCYACGDCTRTCPRQADPSEFMAVARRYAIASYDPLGLAKMLFTSPVLSILLLVLLAFLIALVAYTSHGIMPMDTLRLFTFIPAAVIHDIGVAVLAVIALSGLLGAVNMVVRVRRENGPATTPSVRLNWLGALWETVGVEVLAQRRYRRDCQSATDRRPWFLQNWLAHGATLWGFLGLLAATTLDYGLDLLGLQPTGTWVPLWHPVRLLGTVAGLFLVYGASLLILNRLRKADETTSRSSVSDWAFLALLWLTGISGFALEIAVYLPHPAAWAYWMLLGHISVAVELLLLAPFTKFAHAMYRTIALYLHALEPLPAAEGSAVAAD
jgi:ferredoxin